MDATFWAMIALFIFIGVVVYMKVPGMIAKALDERAAKIRNELDEAQRLREEAQQLLAEFQKKRKEAEKEAADMVAAAKRESDAHHRGRAQEDRGICRPPHRARRAEDRPGRARGGQRGALDRRRRRHRGGAQAARRQARRKDQRRAVQGFADGGQDQAELKRFARHFGASRLANALPCVIRPRGGSRPRPRRRRRQARPPPPSRNGEKVRRCSRAQAPATSIAARWRSVA